LVFQHPATTEYGQGFEQMTNTLKVVRDISIERNISVIGLWPNADAGSGEVAKGIGLFRERRQDQNFHFY